MAEVLEIIGDEQTLTLTVASQATLTLNAAATETLVLSSTGPQGPPGASGVTNVTGLIEAGTNITLDGSGTSGDPYVINGSGGGTWGSITGTLSSQTDLQTALTGKASSSHTHVAADVTDFSTAADARIT